MQKEFCSERSAALLVSLSLTGIFVVAFLSEHLRRKATGPEHDSRLPLDDTDITRRPDITTNEPKLSEDHH